MAFEAGTYGVKKASYKRITNLQKELKGIEENSPMYDPVKDQLELCWKQLLGETLEKLKEYMTCEKCDFAPGEMDQSNKAGPHQWGDATLGLYTALMHQDFITRDQLLEDPLVWIVDQTPQLQEIETLYYKKELAKECPLEGQEWDNE